MVTTK